MCPNITAIILERFISDHRPILLREVRYDYGPIPFRFYRYWLEVDGFDKLVRDSWNVAPVNKKNAIRNFMGKLKFLKDRIRSWLSIHRSNSRGEIYFLKEELRSCDEVIDKGDCSNEVVHKRTEILNKIHQVNNIQASEIAQKAKIKWAIEGDENVKFFHGMLNKKRNQSNIRGIMVNGTWVDDPVQVKREFFEHFRGRFDKPSVNRACIDTPFPVSLSIDQKEDMERRISKEEVKRAVWDCGVDKSPGPDGFSFSFYRHFWPVIEKDVFEAVDYFFMYGEIPNGCNSNFIALIPKILDANMVKDFRPINHLGVGGGGGGGYSAPLVLGGGGGYGVMGGWVGRDRVTIQEREREGLISALAPKVSTKVSFLTKGTDILAPKVSTRVDHKFPFLESIEKHLFDDHFELHDPNNYQTPHTYPSYNDNDLSFLENSEESLIYVEDISIVFNELSSSQSSESSPSYSSYLDEPLINLDDLYKIHSILDDNSDQFLNPLSDSTTSTSSIDSTPHIYSNTNIEVSSEFLAMSKDIQPDSVAPIVANHSANSDSTKGAIKNPLKWDFSTGNVSPICKEATSSKKDSLTMACVTAQAPQLPFRHDKSYRGIRRQPRGKYTAEMRNPEKKGSILYR
ncbi:RNA-directed DNA polymerase, eukaryota [Tanacetum coccineum]